MTCFWYYIRATNEAIIAGKNRITHSLHARMKEQKSMLFLKVFSLKNLINEYILSHLFPRNTKIQMNAVDLESMFYGGSVN